MSGKSSKARFGLTEPFPARVIYRAAFFGGAVLMRNSQFEEANGYSNYYVEWGGEDIDLMYR